MARVPTIGTIPHTYAHELWPSSLLSIGTGKRWYMDSSVDRHVGVFPNFRAGTDRSTSGRASLQKVPYFGGEQDPQPFQMSWAAIIASAISAIVTCEFCDLSRNRL